jgi:hypothetical protein
MDTYSYERQELERSEFEVVMDREGERENEERNAND